jgi:pimeloyl-ACP methyl ester carboxylesterase
MKAQNNGRRIDVDGIETHYLDVGRGEPVVLLHSGEYGGSAELSWEYTIPSLAQRYRVIAPDWLGFGRTDKLFDFGGQRQRMIRHMARFLEKLGIASAHFMGSSMGASMLLEVAAKQPMAFPIRSVVASSGGGFVPFNDARRVLTDYDGSKEAMERMVGVMFLDPRWSKDEAYVTRRWTSSLVPGAWECASAARLRAPGAASGGNFGRPDDTPYEAIQVPTLLVAGDSDPLREKGYAGRVSARIPGGRVEVFERCSHMPHIEYAEQFNALALDFLARR